MLDDTVGSAADENGSVEGVEPDEWTPPSREEWDRTRKALAAANQEAKDRRERLKELQAKTEDADGKAAREQAEAAERRYKPIAVRAAAKAAFLESGLQGVTPERVSKLTRLLDLDSIDVNDDGDVSGLDEQVAAIKADYPELFTAAVDKSERKAPRVATGDKPATSGGPRRSSDLIAARVLGG